MDMYNEKKKPYLNHNKKLKVILGGNHSQRQNILTMVKITEVPQCHEQGCIHIDDLTSSTNTKPVLGYS